MKKNVTKKQLTELGYLVLVSIVWLLIGWFLRGWLASSDEYILLQNIQSIVQQEFPGDPPSGEVMSLAAAQGMLETLNDPYAVIIPPLPHTNLTLILQVKLAILVWCRPFTTGSLSLSLSWKIAQRKRQAWRLGTSC